MPLDRDRSLDAGKCDGDIRLGHSDGARDCLHDDTHPQAQLGLESNADESNTSAEKQQHLPQVANFQSLNTKKKLQNHVRAAYFCAQHTI